MPYKIVDIKNEIKDRLENEPQLKSAYETAVDEYEVLKQLVKIRNELGYSQKEVAQQSGLTQQMVSRIETVDNSPTLRNFMKYIRGMGLELRIERKESSHVDCRTETMRNV
jgi:predicted transcriptional regulator